MTHVCAPFLHAPARYSPGRKHLDRSRCSGWQRSASESTRSSTRTCGWPGSARGAESELRLHALLIRIIPDLESGRPPRIAWAAVERDSPQRAPRRRMALPDRDERIENTDATTQATIRQRITTTIHPKARRDEPHGRRRTRISRRPVRMRQISLRYFNTGTPPGGSSKRGPGHASGSRRLAASRPFRRIVSAGADRAGCPVQAGVRCGSDPDVALWRRALGSCSRLLCSPRKGTTFGFEVLIEQKLQDTAGNALRRRSNRLRGGGSPQPSRRPARYVDQRAH